jgi:hypothetical protein
MWYPKPENNRTLNLYPDQPPEEFVFQDPDDTVALDSSEFVRTKWFWKRRPKGLVRFFTPNLQYDRDLLVNFACQCYARFGRDSTRSDV